MNRAQPSFSLQEQPAKAEKPSSPTGLVFQTWQKGLLLCLALGILYFRMLKRKQAKVVMCSHCGKKNPPHLSNCQKCAAPLLRL